MTRPILAVVGALVLSGGVPAAQVGPAPTDLARAIQAHYDTVRDFRADFTQTHKGAFLRQTSVERGRLVVKKPNRLRISYTGRPRKEFVADGKLFYAHFVEDKFGTETPLAEATDSSVALLFLAGRGSLLTDFVPASPATHPDGRWRLVLKPKRPQDFDTLTIVVERSTYRLAGLITDDDESGTSEFQFSNLRENTGVADRDFAFTWPPGTEVR